MEAMMEVHKRSAPSATGHGARSRLEWSNKSIIN